MDDYGPRLRHLTKPAQLDNKRFVLEWIVPLEPGLSTHVALYDKEEYVTPAIAKLTEFFRTHLARSTWDRTRMTVA